MNPYPMPMDSTGFGPAQTGFFPTAAQAHQAEMQRFYTSRAAQAMQFQDPWIRQFAAGAAKAAGANPSDPVAMRQQMYGTAFGQAALDTATMLRSSGMLGQGNPMAYSYHVNRGISSGGFGMNVLNPEGNAMGPMQMVYGQGVLTDRVAMSAQRSLLQNLYGSGTADPSKLNGMNMESAGMVAADIARARGPSMGAATLVQNADLGLRVRSAISGNDDPMIKAGLSELTKPQLERMQALSANGSTKDIEEFTKAFDPKMKNEVTALIKSKSALLPDEGWGKEMADAVRSVSKGIASLRDVYEGLTDPQLKMQMESLTGIRVRDAASGHRASRMISNMRGAADASGHDAQTYFGFMQGAYAGMGQTLAGITGIGERGADTMGALENMFKADATQRAGIGEQASKETAAMARSMGVNVEPQSLQSIAADIKGGQQQFVKLYGGVTSLSGARGRFIDDKKRETAKQILEKFSKTTDPRERAALERQAKDLLGSEFGSYAQYEGSRAHEDDLAVVGANAGGEGDYVTDRAAEGMLRDVNVGGLKDVLGDDARMFVEAGGARTFADLETISKSTLIKGSDKNSQMITMLVNQDGMSRADAERVVSKLYNGTGQFRGSEGSRAATMRTLAGMNPDTTATARGKSMRASASLQAMDKDVDAVRSATGGDMSLKGMVNAMLSEQTGVLDSESGRIALLQTMKGDGMKIFGKSGADLTDRVLSGMDVSEGMTADMVKQINGAVGGDFDLAGASGYKNADELIAASKTSTGLAGILGKLQGNSRLSVTGGRRNLSVMSRDALDDIDPEAQASRFKSFALSAKYLYPEASDRDVSLLAESFKDGKKIDIGLAADETPSVHGGKAVLPNYKRIRDLSGRLVAGSDDDIASLMSTEGGQQILEQLKAEQTTMANIQAKGATSILAPDGKSGSVTHDVTKSKEVLDKLIERLESVSTQTVDRMVITNAEIHNMKPTQ